MTHRTMSERSTSELRPAPRCRIASSIAQHEVLLSHNIILWVDFSPSQTELVYSKAVVCVVLSEEKVHIKYSLAGNGKI